MHDTQRHGTQRHDTQRHDTQRHDAQRHDTQRHDTMKVVQVYGFCICTLHFPMKSVIIIGVMRLSYSERAVSADGTVGHYLLAFVRTNNPSRYVYSRQSRVYTAVDTAVTAIIVM